MSDIKLDSSLKSIRSQLKQHYRHSALRFWPTRALKQPLFLAALSVFHIHHFQNNRVFIDWFKTRTRDTELTALLDDLYEDKIFRKLIHDMLSTTHPTSFSSQADAMLWIRNTYVPLGRIYLLQCRAQSEENNALMDGIVCATGLAYLALQAPALYLNNQASFAEDEMQRYNVTENQLAESHFDFAYKRLMEFNLNRARKLLDSGAPLGKKLGFFGGFGLRRRIEALARLMHQGKQEETLTGEIKLSLIDSVKVLFYAAKS